MANLETVVTEITVFKSNETSRQILKKSKRRAVALTGPDYTVSLDLSNTTVLAQRTFGPIVNVLVVEASTPITISLKSLSGDTAQQITSKLFLIYGALHEVVLSTTALPATPVSVNVYWS